jgi:hypothetical protein
VNTLAQFGRRNATSYGQPQIRADFSQRIEHRYGDGEVAKTVAGDIYEEMTACLHADILLLLSNNDGFFRYFVHIRKLMPARLPSGYNCIFLETIKSL